MLFVSGSPQQAPSREPERAPTIEPRNFKNFHVQDFLFGDMAGSATFHDDNLFVICGNQSEIKKGKTNYN